MIQLSAELFFSTGHFDMKATKIFFSCCFVLSSLWLLCGCSTNHVDSSNREITPMNGSNVPLRDLSGADRVFTNANFVMWVPSRAVHVWDGHTSVVDVDETTLPDAFVKDYKIAVEIQISDTAGEFQQMEQWSSSNWYFKDFPEMATRETGYGIQIRKDIWNSEKTRRFLINAMVNRSDTFQADVKTAEKMVESIKLLPK